MNKLDEAEPLYREALAIRRESLPAGHPNIALSLNNLAVLLKDQGKLAEAEPLYREALAIQRDAHTPGHPSIATSLGNLAVLQRPKQAGRSRADVTGTKRWRFAARPCPRGAWRSPTP